MYRPDVVSLKQFYASGLGQAASAAVWNRLRALWPDAAGETVLGIGYATPYFAAECSARGLTVACMPAAQGALYWPHAAPNRVVMADDGLLPFGDNLFNRVLLIHALEHSHQPQALMQEVWRVLTPGGRVLATVPNRHGFWSHSAASPFGYGRPFTLSQMREAVGASGLTFTRAASTLFLPPVHWRWLVRAMPWAESAGAIIAPRLGGVLFVEAEKQIYAAVKEPVRARGKAPIPALKPIISTRQ